MKRSEAIKKLIHKVISPYEVVTKENYDSGIYEDRARRLLEFIEKDLGMEPPKIRVYLEIPLDDNSVPGFKLGEYVNKWEDE